MYILKNASTCVTQKPIKVQNQEIPPTLPRKTLAYFPWNNNCFYFLHNLFSFVINFDIKVSYYIWVYTCLAQQIDKHTHIHINT